MATKLYGPALRRGLVPRPRLLALLQRAREARLTLVSAPAGFGKTTLLGEWLGTRPDDDRRLAWLSLDPSDHDPASFWSYVVGALRTALPDVGAGLPELIDSTPVPTELVLTQLVNDLATAPSEVWLVLDDYHLVDNPDVDQALAFLLDHLPPQVHVVLSTRADPGLPLPRWRVRGHLVEIRAADLRFTPAETAAYLAAVSDLQLDAADVHLLAERTEGWIAALQLAVLSIRGRDDVSSLVARFAGDDRYVVDYLVEEVLAHQPDATRTFLLQSAVLDRLTGPLCDAVTGVGGGRQTLEALDRANLFVVALDGRREWYRYHHLFADALRARLLAEQPDQVPLLHTRASQWCERHDLTEDAVTHALAARDLDRASHLMELAVPAIRRHRREAVMHGWLKALPQDTVRRSPVLSLFYGAMLMASGDVDSVDSWLDDAERALAHDPEVEVPPSTETSELLALPSTIAMYRAALAQARGDTTGTAEHARRALALAAPDDHLARAGAAGFLGFAAWAQGDVPGALETFTRAVASLHAAGNLVDALGGTVVLGDLWLAAGRPGQARRLCTRALVTAEAQGVRVARAAAELHVAISELDVERGDLESARLHLETAAALTKHAPMTESRYRWFVAKALLSRADGDLEESVRLLDQAQQAHRPGFFPDVRPVPALRARTWIMQGVLSAAADWATERGVSVADEARYLSEFDHLTLVRLLLGRTRADPESDALAGAGDLLDRLAAAAEAGGRAGSVLEIRLLQALVQDARGRRSQAVETLAGALRRAPEPDGYLRHFVDEGAPLLGLVHAAEQAGVDGAWVRRVLADGARDTAPRAVSGPPVPSGAAGPLTDRELEVLRLLDSELTGPQIARELFVTPNTMRTHTKHIFTKLDVTTRRAAVLRARERGLL